MIDPRQHLEEPTDRHDNFESIADATCRDMIDSFNTFRHKSDIVRLIERCQEVLDVMREIVQKLDRNE